MNIFVLDTGVDCEHDELRGRCENVGSYSNFFPGGYWRNKEDGSWGGGWETGDPFKKANDDFDGHGPVAVYELTSRRRRRGDRTRRRRHRRDARVNPHRVKTQARTAPRRPRARRTASRPKRKSTA